MTCNNCVTRYDCGVTHIPYCSPHYDDVKEMEKAANKILDEFLDDEEWDLDLFDTAWRWRDACEQALPDELTEQLDATLALISHLDKITNY